MLRQALGDSGERQRHVRTVRGRGYALRGERVRDEIGADESKGDESKGDERSVPVLRKRRTWAAAATGLLLAAGAGTYLYQSAQDVVLYDEERGSLFVGAAVGDGFDRPLRGKIGEVDVIMLGMPSPEAMAASAAGRQLLCEEAETSADLRQVLASNRLKSRCVEAESALP